MIILQITACFSNCIIESVTSIFISVFFAILFLQSGLDKVFNYKKELNWTKEHFSRSVLAGSVSVMFAVLTVLELLTGILCVMAPFFLYYNETDEWFLFSNLSVNITLLALFFGQRMAKDYQGAASLAGYFIISILGLYLIFL